MANTTISEAERKAAEAQLEDGDSEATEVSAATAYLVEHGLNPKGYSSKEVLEKARRLREAKKKNVQILSKGPTSDRIEAILAKVPRGLVGQFVRENDTDINRYKAMGFEMFKDPNAAKESPHGTADDRIRLGDLVLMIAREEEVAAIRAVRREQRQRRRDASDPKKKAKRQMEAAGFTTYEE